MRYFWIAILAALIFPVYAVETVEAGQYCKTNQSCRQEVRAQVGAQNAAASSGPRWSLSIAGCRKASREQMANERRCRSYDLQPGGKDHSQCAKCYRQAVFDAARWEQCHAIGMAPRPPAAIYQSIARLGRWADG